MDEAGRKRLTAFLAECADLLLPHLDEPNVTVATRGIDDDTPLHLAALRGDTETISLLIEAGAEIDAKGDLSVTPLYQAVMEGHAQAAALLLAAGADPDAMNELDATPRQRATRGGDPALTRLFDGGNADG